MNRLKRWNWPFILIAIGLLMVFVSQLGLGE